MIIGWLAAGVVLLFGLIRLDLGWSLFSFHPKLDFGTVEDISIILMAETLIWFLAKASRDLASHITSLIVCLFLARNAAANYYYAAQPSRYIFGGIREPDPLWYRIGLTFLPCLPMVFWIWWERRRLVQKCSSNGNQ